MEEISPTRDLVGGDICCLCTGNVDRFNSLSKVLQNRFRDALSRRFLDVFVDCILPPNLRLRVPALREMLHREMVVWQFLNAP